MFGEYKKFKTKFQDSYNYYKIDLNKIVDKNLRDDIKLIPEAIGLGYKVREGESFGDTNVFERKISENETEVIWIVFFWEGGDKWKKNIRKDGQYESGGEYFNSLSEALNS
jgi:hypothetical protein